MWPVETPGKETPRLVSHQPGKFEMHPFRHTSDNIFKFQLPSPLISLKIVMAYWLVKSEPFKYSWQQFEEDGQTFWNGVRNYAARNNLREMKKGEEVFFYHSNEGLEIVGIAKVVKEHYPDNTATEGDWVMVDLKPFKKLKKPVTLAQMKADKRLQEMKLIKLGRLSVSPVTADEWKAVMELGGTK
jgi:predicted RNA-binding protein with PUA-like domain